SSLRYTWVQNRSDYASPRALLDPHVHQAILHAIDRPALAEVILQDRSLAADTVPPRTVAYYPDIDRVVRKYPYDPKRTEQLMGEAGFVKGPDGVFVSTDDSRFHLDLRGSPGGQEELDTTIVANDVKQAGLDPTITWIDTLARSYDDEAKGSFPGLF